MNRKISWSLVLCLICVYTSVCAQSPLSSPDYYGRGLHAFFSGNSSQARHYLTMAIGNRPNDPRPYYFRALCNLRSGLRYEAEQDMEIGAALESQSLGTYAIGQALQRVQGGHRLTLERYRNRARTAQHVDSDVVHDYVHDVVHDGQQSYYQEPQQTHSGQHSKQNLWRPVRVPLEQLTGNPLGADFAQRGEFQSPDWIGQPGSEQSTANDIVDDPGSLQTAQESDPFRDDIGDDVGDVEDSSVEAQVESEKIDSDTSETDSTEEEADPFGVDMDEDDPFGSF